MAREKHSKAECGMAWFSRASKQGADVEAGTSQIQPFSQAAWNSPSLHEFLLLTDAVQIQVAPYSGSPLGKKKGSIWPNLALDSAQVCWPACSSVN